MSPSILAKGTFIGTPYAGQSVGGFELRHVISDLRQGEVELHTHDTAHVMLVTGGCYASDADGAGEPAQSLLIYNPAGTTHRDHFCSGLGSFFTMTVAVDLMADLTELSPTSDRATLVALPEAARLASELARASSGSPATPHLATEAVCLELIAIALKLPADSAGPRPPWLDRAEDVIRDRFAEPLSMAEVAAEAGVHPVHLARAFRRFNRCTPGQHLRRRRLQKAAEYLIEGRRSLVEIGLSSGFGDQAYFTSVFSAAYGLPPGKYRRLVRGRA